MKKYGIIIGAMKCGTTTLFELLRHHPQVAPCTAKEPNFFTSPYRWADGIDRYEDLYDFDEKKKTIRLEATTDYAKLPYLDYVFARMKSFADHDYRFIYLMRNPIERVRSHVLHTAATGAEILSLKPNEPGARNVNGIPASAINISRYADHIERYQAEFGPERLMVGFFEDLKADPQHVVDRACEHLGLTSFTPPSGVHANKARTMEQVPLWQSARRVSALRSAAHLLPQGVRDALWQRFGLRKRAETYELTESQKETVLDLLRDDLLRLRDRHGFDVEEKWSLDLATR